MAADYRPISLDEQPIRPYTISEILVEEIRRAECIVADLSGRNPNVFYEIGLAKAQGKPIFLLVDESDVETIPVDLRAYPYIAYSQTVEGSAELAEKLTASLIKYRRAPHRFTSPGTLPQVPFYVNWDLIDDRDEENLCLELLLAMGFQRVEWSGQARGIDLVAELPKRDPDGFDYKELWLVSTGRSEPLEHLIEMAFYDMDYLMHSLVKDGLISESAARGNSFDNITILLIPLHSKITKQDFDKILSKQSRRERSMRFGSKVRFRFWDRAQITGLVYQYPAIGLKYFSDEIRSHEKYRKSPEELYRENNALTLRQRLLITALEEEKAKRVTAERDAIWKDISFAAAHKIGNPIFAIEAGLDPLERRITENRPEEARHVLGIIRESVERSKAIIDQFKSLTKAQKISKRLFQLRPLLDRACEIAEGHGINCDVTCSKTTKIFADPDRIGECLEELIANACHYFDKEVKAMSFVVTPTVRKPYPSGLNIQKQYILLTVTDNGPGVPVAEKEKIFDAFFTLRDQGTGLGLALVRRILEGHDGLIVEVGSVGEGARFDLYIPKVVVKKHAV